MTDPHRILVVEDHADSAVMLTRLLKRSGYEVSAAGNVADGLQMAQSWTAAGTPFHLLVSDLGLPDASGYELMEKIALDYHIPGIALSGYGQANDVSRALAAGFSKHLTKPIDFDLLKVAINELLGNVTQPTKADS